MTVTGVELTRWRLLKRWTQDQAAAWYGLTGKNRARTWRRWELGEVPVPAPLEKRIRDQNGGLNGHQRSGRRGN